VTTTPLLAPAPWRVIALLVAACSVSAFDYAVRQDPALLEGRVASHRGIVTRTAFEPDRFRVLVPWIVEPIARLAAREMPYESAVRRVYGVVSFGLLVLMLSTLLLYVRQWFLLERALVGVLLVAATMPIALRQHYLAPWSLLEPSLLTLMLIGVSTHRLRLMELLALTLVAALNRETGVIIPAAFVVVAWNELGPRRALMWGLPCIGVGAAVILLVRWVIGPGILYVTLADIWRTNSSREGFAAAMTNVALFLGCTGWILAAIGARRAPAFTKRALWIGALYLPLIWVWGVWYEVRLLMPFYPILVPLVLSALWVPETSDRRLSQDRRVRPPEAMGAHHEL
jgi:hypothetical protein